MPKTAKKRKEYHRLSINLPKDLRDRFVEYCHEQDSDISKMVRRLIKQALGEEE